MLNLVCEECGSVESIDDDNLRTGFYDVRCSECGAKYERMYRRVLGPQSTREDVLLLSDKMAISSGVKFRKFCSGEGYPQILFVISLMFLLYLSSYLIGDTAAWFLVVPVLFGFLPFKYTFRNSPYRTIRSWIIYLFLSMLLPFFNWMSVTSTGQEFRAFLFDTIDYSPKTSTPLPKTCYDFKTELEGVSGQDFWGEIRLEKVIYLTRVSPRNMPSGREMMCAGQAITNRGVFVITVEKGDQDYFYVLGREVDPSEIRE